MVDAINKNRQVKSETPPERKEKNRKTNLAHTGGTYIHKHTPSDHFNIY